MITKFNRGSQSNLYQTSEILITNGRNNMAALQAFSPKYSSAFMDSLEALRTEAMSLPDEMQRSALHKVKRIDTMDASKVCLQKWQMLKRYIATAFASSSEGVTEANWEAAGWSYYEKAANQNWEDVVMLMNAGSIYLNENGALLEANENMPAGFADDFATAKDAYDAALNAFYLAEELASTQQQEKVNANDILYTAIVAMCEDGQIVFINDEARKEQFSYEAVSELVSPSGSSTLIVTVTDAETAMPLAGAEVHVNGTDRTVITDAEGRAEIGVLSAGAASGTIVRDGYADSAFSTTLTTGTTTRIEASLTAMVPNPGPEAVSTPEPVTV